MRFVTVKTVGQQEIQAVHRIRSELVGQRTAKGNQIRGLVAEYGLVAPQQINHLRAAVPEWLEDAENGLSDRFRRLLNGLWDDLKRLDERVSEMDKERLLGISKRGNAYLRSLLIHGARSAIYAARGKEDRLSQWVMSIATRRHPNVAAVALSNKTARIAWAKLPRPAHAPYLQSM